MSKYKLTTLCAILFTIPLCGYFIVNGYWWLFNGNNPNEDKMYASLFAGFVAIFLNVMAYLSEDGQL